jgi:hypothetical protein
MMSDAQTVSAERLGEYTALVKEAKAKFNAAQGEMVDFVVYLREIEHGGRWRLPQYAGFGDFLAAEFPAAFGVRRYQNIAKAIEVYGSDFMRRMGADSAHALTVDAVLVEPANVAKIREWCEAHWMKHGVMPDANTVRGWTMRLTPVEKARAPRVVEQQETARALQAEVIALRRLETKAEKAIGKVDTWRERALTAEAELKTARGELRDVKARVKELEKENARQARQIERLSGATKPGGARKSVKDAGKAASAVV